MKKLFKWTVAGMAIMLAFIDVPAQTRHTFCNPLDVVVGNEPAIRGGEPVVIIFDGIPRISVTGHMWMLPVIPPVWYRWLRWTAN